MKRAVYLHGFASGPSSKKARYFREHLTGAGWDVAVPALDGGDFESLTITGQLAIVEAALAGEPAPIIGSSMGGYLAALYAARHRDVPCVVLLAPAFDFAARFRARVGEAEVERWKRAGRAPVYHYGAGREMALGYGLMEDAERYEAFPSVTQPCLIFHGRQDDVVPIGLSREFAHSRPNVRLEEMESGHELTDVFELMGDPVAAFLSAAARY